MLAEIFRRLVDVLEACGIPYMLTGSFASSYYGAPRGTQDNRATAGTHVFKRTG
jgi:hypothetical protein